MNLGEQKVPYVEGNPRSGLTKREYFVGLAMQGLLTRVPQREGGVVDLGSTELKRIIEESVLMADAILEALTKK